MLAQATSDVTLSIPAKPDYLVLARLALSAICRLTPLGPEAAADLKLAVNEAATEFVRDDQSGDEVAFRFSIAGDWLELELSGTRLEPIEDEHELSRAIADAICDSAAFEADRTVLGIRLEARP